MGILFRRPVIGTLFLFMATNSIAEESKTPPMSAEGVPPEKVGDGHRGDDPDIETSAPEDEMREADETGEVIEAIVENTLEMCQDGEDNDADSHVDCDDQDCEIFAVCVSASGAGKKDAPSSPESERVLVPLSPLLPERGIQCRDGIDNDGNELIDCHDDACRGTYYCKRIMYERLEPSDKPPRLLINTAVGAALPNYRLPTAETKWNDLETGDTYNIPFDPDIGVMLDIQIGYLFMPWLGAGVGFKSAFTYASNRELYFVSDDDEGDYKYVGSKFYGNISAFIRAQWPVGRLVPYIGLHVGYSVYQATWHVYDSSNSWSEIDEYEVDDSNYIYGERTEIRTDRKRHFTFAVEPGIDVFVVKRMFGIGLKGWLPVVANKNAEADNIGVLFNLTFTPMWREPLVLKPEYAKKK